MAVAPAAAPASALGAGAGSDAAARLSLLDRGDCTYTACYCEENAYLLAQRLAQTGAVPTADCLHVVFVSNPRKQVWAVRAAGPQQRQGCRSAQRGVLEMRCCGCSAS